MTDESFFTAEELAAFREVDRLRALEPVDRGAGRWERLRLQSEEPEKHDRGLSAREVDAKIRHHWDSVFNDAIAQFTSEYVSKRLDGFAEMVGGETGLNEKALRTELVAKIEKLEVELGQLRADLQIQRSVKTADIIDLPDWRRSDVA
jgi:hypothetical protein